MSPRMSILAPGPSNSVNHDEHLIDRAAMLAMRAMMALQPAAEFGTEGRAAFDDLMESRCRAQGTRYHRRIPPAQPRDARPSHCHPPTNSMEKRHDSHPVRRPEA